MMIATPSFLLSPRSFSPCQPVVYLHGGPGGGTTPSNRRFFDPQFFRIILFDQVLMLMLLVMLVLMLVLVLVLLLLVLLLLLLLLMLVLVLVMILVLTLMLMLLLLLLVSTPSLLKVPAWIRAS